MGVPDVLAGFCAAASWRAQRRGAAATSSAVARTCIFAWSAGARQIPRANVDFASHMTEISDEDQDWPPVSGVPKAENAFEDPQRHLAYLVHDDEVVERHHF